MALELDRAARSIRIRRRPRSVKLHRAGTSPTPTKVTAAPDTEESAAIMVNRSDSTTWPVTITTSLGATVGAEAVLTPMPSEVSASASL